MGRITDAVKHLIILNVLFFVATYLYGDQMYEWFSLWFPQNGHFGWWQVVTHMFMHGGFMHILFNMYALWIFGSPLEQMWGRNKFFFFYFSAGLGAAFLHTAVNYFYFHEGATNDYVLKDINGNDLPELTQGKINGLRIFSLKVNE